MNDQPKCPKGHPMKGRGCTVCTYFSPPPPPVIEIHWGDSDFEFANAADALASGFHLK